MDDKIYYSEVTLAFSFFLCKYFPVNYLCSKFSVHFWPTFEYVLHIKLFWADSYLIVSSNYFWIFHYQNLCDGNMSRVQIRNAKSTRKYFFSKSRSHWLANEENLTFSCLKMTLNGFSFIEINRIVFLPTFYIFGFTDFWLAIFVRRLANWNLLRPVNLKSRNLSESFFSSQKLKI